MRLLVLSSLLLSFELVMGTAAQAGFLISSSEAEKRDQLACQPSMILGMVECEALPAPPAARGNDADIKPAEFVQSTGPSFGSTVDETPLNPFLDPVPTRIKSGPFSLRWNIGFGSSGQWWEVWDNSQLRYRGRNFVRHQLNTPEQSATDGVVVEAVQGGVFSATQLEPGLHKWSIRLCNGSLKEPKCSESTAETWVDAAANNANQAPLAQPEVPQLAWTPSVTTEGVTLLRWNVYWGNIGQQWEVLNYGKPIYRSTKFTDEAEKSQEGQVQLPLANGVYELSIRLCMKSLCSESDKVTVEAMLGPEIKPTVPKVKIFTAADPELGDGLAEGQVILSWQTAQPSVAPDHWLLLDANKREVIFSQKISKTCSPGIWCGSWQGTPPELPASWVVKLCRAKQCVDSEIIEIPAE